MNHLLIGLGGTGGKIIQALRSQIGSDFIEGQHPAARLGYLYVDTNFEPMQPAHPASDARAPAGELHPVDELNIGARDLAARLDELDFSGIRPWIGDKDVWADILGSVAGGSLSGQKRRLGRFLFACHAHQFRTKVQSQLAALQADGSTGVTFHVAAGLAGGTGGGSLIDAIAQLRALYPDPRRYRILLYLQLPERLPDPAWDVGNYHANGYATLAELNAMSASALHPWDVTGGGSRLVLEEPFTGAYLFGDEKDNGDRIDADRELPSIAADFLFQKIIVAGQAEQGLLERLERADHRENASDLSSASRRAEHSRRFLSFGIQRIAIPKNDIGGRLALSFAGQAIQQLRFNNWRDGAGYIDTPGVADPAAFVRQADVRERWRIGNDHLTLSSPILPTDDPAKRWKPIEQEWRSIVEPMKSVVREQKRSLWLSEFARLMEKRFLDDYRGCGVEPFYKNALTAKQDMARVIRASIEDELFDNWRTGLRSIAEVGGIVEAVIDDLAERQAMYESESKRYLDAAKDHARAVETIWQRSSQTGALSNALLGKTHQQFEECAAYLSEKRVAQTCSLASDFAAALIEAIRAELAELKAAVAALSDDLRRAHLRVQSEMDQRVDGKTRAARRGPFGRLHDPAAATSAVRALAFDQTIQRAQTATLRDALADRLGDNGRFAAFGDDLRGTALSDFILANAEASASQARKMAVPSADERFDGRSIIGVLEQRYGTDQRALEAFVRDVVGQSEVLLRSDPLGLERSKSGGSADGPSFAAAVMVTLPAAPAHARFVARLKQAFRQARPGSIEFFDATGHDREITVTSIRSLFPARHAAIVALLRDRYRHRIAENPKRFSQELHTEGDGTQLPDLFMATYRVIDGGKQTIRQLRGA